MTEPRIDRRGCLKIGCLASFLLFLSPFIKACSRFESLPTLITNPGAIAEAMSLMDMSTNILDNPNINIPGGFAPIHSFPLADKKSQITTWYALQGRFPEDPKHVPLEDDFIVAYNPETSKFRKISINGLDSDMILEKGFDASSKFYVTAQEYAAKKGYILPADFTPPIRNIIRTETGATYNYMELPAYGDTLGAMLKGGSLHLDEATRIYQEAYEMSIMNWYKTGQMQWDPHVNNIAVLKATNQSGKVVNMALPFDFELANDLTLPVNKTNLEQIKRVWQLNAKSVGIDIPATLPDELLTLIPESIPGKSVIRTFVGNKVLNIAIDTAGMTVDEEMQVNLLVNYRVSNMTKSQVKKFIDSGMTGKVQLLGRADVEFSATVQRDIAKTFEPRNFMSALKVLGPILVFLPGTLSLPDFYRPIPTTQDSRTLLLAMTTNGEVNEQVSLTGLYEQVMFYKEMVKSYFNSNVFLDTRSFDTNSEMENFLEKAFGENVGDLLELEEVVSSQSDKIKIRDYIEQTIERTAVPIPIQVEFGSDALIVGGVKAEFPFRVSAFEVDGVKHLIFWYPEQKEVYDQETGETIKTVIFKPSIEMIQSADDPKIWKGEVLDNLANTTFVGTNFSWPIDNTVSFANCQFIPFGVKDQTSTLDISCKLQSTIK